MTSIEVRQDGSGCDTVWTNPAPSTTVRKFSLPNGNIYTVKRGVTGSTPQYFLVAIDFRTCKTPSEEPIGDSYALDTFQLASTIGPHGVLYQPTVSGIIRVRPGAKLPKTPFAMTYPQQF